jgi:hypothetical protein
VRLGRGFTYEIGGPSPPLNRPVAPDRARALSAYRKACSAKEKHACEELARLEGPPAANPGSP